MKAHVQAIEISSKNKSDSDLFGASEPKGRAPLKVASRSSSAEAGYTAADIEVLEGLEPVRRRPGMYIGGTDEKALHHLFAEVIDNSMDEALAGHATFIEVELGADGFLTVTDNGRGIPVDPHPKFPKKSALEVIMCTLHSGGKFDSKVYETSGGLHGVGVSVVNALSSRLEVEVARSQKLYRMTFERGHPKGKLEDLGKINNRRGTRIRFKPDTDIFGAKAAFKPQRLFKMARSKAYLFGGVEIRWRCDPALLKGIDDVPAEDTFHFAGGLKDYLAAAVHADTLVHPDIFSGKSGRVGAHGACEWAVAWTADADGFLSSYCNTVPTPGRRHPRSRHAQRDAARPEGSCRARRPGQARRRHRLGRRHGGRGRDALGVRARAGIPGPDQGPPRHRRSAAHRRTGDQGSVRSLARGQSGAGQQAARFRHRARRRAAAPPRRKRKSRARPR